jgi:hypothetical protein
MRKTGRKSVFHSREVHILAPLDITLLYTIFLCFEIYWISTQKPKGVAFGFKGNIYSRQKPSENPYFISVGGHILARLDIMVLYTFLRFWTISSFNWKHKGFSLLFYKKCLFAMKTGKKPVFHLCEAHILAWLYITVLYTIFWGFEKYRVSAQTRKGLAFCFTNRHLYTVKIGWKSIFHLNETIFLLV